ncbi:conserved Plasmodium protein, unknown function [Plasmodium gallinaceum]|uniref:Uncharacterized protein n=1 Tax=Plasmodium gallinaceum TaxID=5849 RepID=A0A1J1GM17_PLAGA|nr:conserved Plasmodium protein, unknown function [Plasmodium gallinaceum]CRG93433.1 conserved Plasmodium protein, unknown function [Plasmodium gallinaceum]
MSISNSHSKNLGKCKNIFIYNKMIEELVEKIILLANNLSLFRKKYKKYVKKKKKKNKIQKEKEKEKEVKPNEKNLYLLNESNDFFLNSSFFKTFKEYEELVDKLIHLCNNHTDIYIEFLYILLINSKLFNNFLFICTFTSGDKNDTFLFLIYKNFLILTEYYYYFNNFSYFNDLYYKLKNIYIKKNNNKKNILNLRQKNIRFSFLDKDKNNLLYNTNEINDIRLFKNKSITCLYNYSSHDSDFLNIEYNRRYMRKKTNEEKEKYDEKKNNHVENNNKYLFTNSDKSTCKSNINLSNESSNKCNIYHIKKKEHIIKKDKLKIILNKTFSNFSDNQTNFKNLNKKIYTKNGNNSYDSTDNKNAYFNQKLLSHKNFNIKIFYQLKNMIKTFKKLKYEHLYILLYFSLCILPSLFHIYLTRIMRNQKNYFNISHYLIYLSKKIKFCTLIYLKRDNNVPKEKEIYSLKSDEKITFEKKGKNNQIDFTHILDDFQTKYINKECLSKGKKRYNGINNNEAILNMQKNKDPFIEEYKNNYYEIEKKNDLLNESNEELWQFINNFKIKDKFDKLMSVNNSNKDYTLSAKKKLSLLHMFQIENDFKELNFKIMKNKSEENLLESNILNVPLNISDILKEKKIYNNNIQKIKKEKLNERKKKETINDVKEDFIKLLENNLKIEKIYLYYKKINENELLNYVGFHNLIKSVSIICNDEFCSFYMNNIDIKNSVEKNHSTLNIVENTYKINKKKEESDIIDSIHISSLNIDSALIHNEYIKKKIKKNKLYTYKLFNNQIETLLNSRELIEFIKKQKEAKRKKENFQKDKKKDNFIYSQYQYNNNLLNNEKKKYDDIFKFIENKNNKSDILESDYQSYKNSESSDNLTLCNYTKNYYSKNNFNIDYFVFFIVNTFYIFLHLHNIYFSSTYLNIFLSFSIKLVYKYSNKFENLKLLFYKGKFLNKHTFDKIGYIQNEIDLSKTNEDNLDKNILETSLKQKNIREEKSIMRFIKKSSNFKIKKSYNSGKNENYNIENSTYNDLGDEKIKELGELLLKKKKFKNKKKIENNIFFNKNNNDFLPNTFDLIINTFFDLCISLCSIDFKYISCKKKKFNRTYFCDNIFFYHHLINKRYSNDSMDKFNISNYNNSVESYLFYFDELRNEETFTRKFAENNYFYNYYKDNNNMKNNNNRKKKKNLLNNHKYIESLSEQNNNLSSNSSYLFNEDYIKKNIFCKKKKKKKDTESKYVEELLGLKFNDTKKKLFSKTVLENKNEKIRKSCSNPTIANIINEGCNYEKGNYLENKGCSNFIKDLELSSSSDKSFLFLKKMKKKIKNRIYLDENNIINILINIGCIFMNNIKYNNGILLKYLYKMNEYDILNDRKQFYNYMEEIFCRKDFFFSNIYNQYFLSFFFFFKIHYIFFLIKYKCENEIYLKAYWFLYAVYNITQS